MLLRNAPVGAMLPVTDIERAKQFYMEKLGLPSAGIPGPEGKGTAAFECGDRTVLYLYARETGTKADHTVAMWMVDDIEETVGDLSQKGVVFEQYDPRSRFPSFHCRRYSPRRQSLSCSSRSRRIYPLCVSCRAKVMIPLKW